MLCETCLHRDVCGKYKATGGENKCKDFKEERYGRWEVVHGVLTPGGDPLLRCPICKSRESEHLCGIECRVVWHYCPSCGTPMDGGETDV